MTQVLVGEYIRSLSRTGPSLYIFSFKKANWQKWSRMMGDSCVPWSGERERVTKRKGEEQEAHLSLSARLYSVCTSVRCCTCEREKKTTTRKRVTRESESLDILVHFLIIVVDL